MRSPALAIGWEIWRRHRWGLGGVTVYLLLLAAGKFLVLEPGYTIALDDALTFAFLVPVPMGVAFTYLLAVFSFGLTGDLAARQSIYPRRMFALPVSTTSLAVWPMLYGAVAVTILCVGLRSFAIWPRGVHIPSFWPALFAVALLAWTQALMWMPYGFRGLRVVVALLWLTVIDTGVLLAVYFNVSEAVMAAIIVPLIPAACFAAIFALSRARRDDTPEWTGLRLRAVRSPRIVRRRPFASAERAQAWFEWRHYGLSLVGWVAILLPFELALLFAARGAPALVLYILAAVALTPPFMASVVAATVSKPVPGAADSHGITPFIATRPLTSAALVAAKLKATVSSTLLAWLLVLAAVPLALRWSDTWPIVDGFALWLRHSVGTTRAAVIFALVLAALITSTWKQLARSLYIGLSGRAWLIKSSVLLTLAAIVAIGPVVDWILSDRQVLVGVWDALPWILAAAVAMKLFAAAWILLRVRRGALLGRRGLIAAATIWAGATLGLYGLLVWTVVTPLIPGYVLALSAILAIPLARLSAAPLAMAWNRHR